MLKPFAKLLLAILMLLSNSTFAQYQNKLFDKYIKQQRTQFDRVLFHVDKRYFGTHTNDTLNVTINNITEVNQLISAGLKEKVYSVDITRLARNDFSAIFNLLAQFSNLNYIKLSDPIFPGPKQPLYQLPAAIQALQQLKVIEFFYTEYLDIDDVVKKIAALKNLQAIAFTGYYHPLPALVTTFNNLTAVKLSSANIENLDASKTNWQNVIIGNNGGEPFNEKAFLSASLIPNLKQLELNYCNIEYGNILTLFKQVKDMTITYPKIAKDAQLFEKIGTLNKLTDLAITFSRGNDSTQNIDGIQGLTDLKNLSLVGISTFKKNPEQLNYLAGLKNLKILKIAGGLSAMPDVFGRLSNLNTLNISNTELTQVPPSIFNLPKLEYLTLSGNRLTNLPSVKYTSFSLKQLDLSSNRLHDLPESISGLVNLESLNTSYNNISALPSGWQNFKHLKEVLFKFNKLTHFPAGLQDNINIEKLDLENNYIEEIPNLTNNNYQLKYLKLSNNLLKTLPENIGKYSKLEYLYIDGNYLNALPSSLGDCKELRELDIHSTNRRLNFDANRTSEKDSFQIINEPNKSNNITILPSGLKDAKNLQLLNLSNNLLLDAESAFNIILAHPRKLLKIDLKNTNLKTLPASTKWATMYFVSLDISNNKLTTLPIDFASIKSFANVRLSGNSFPIDNSVTNTDMQTKSDMKILFDEIGIPYHDTVSKSEYATSLTQHISQFYLKKNWAKVLEYAQKAKLTDSNAYIQNIRWDHIGTARFNLKDYTGAIDDFNKFITQEIKSTVRIMNFINPVQLYKVNAHIALGQKEEAAKTHLYFAKNNIGIQSSLQQAAILYKELGNEVRYRRLIDSAVMNYQINIDENSKRKNLMSAEFMLDYAEVLLIAEKTAMVVEVLNKPTNKAYNKSELAIKNYLLSTAQYLANPLLFEQIKKSLINDLAVSGKITGWDFEMFNSWVASSGFTTIKKDQLMALQQIAQ